MNWLHWTFHLSTFFSSSTQLCIWKWNFVVWLHHQNWLCIQTTCLLQHQHIHEYLWVILYLQLPYIRQKNLKLSSRSSSVSTSGFSVTCKKAETPKTKNILSWFFPTFYVWYVPQRSFKSFFIFLKRPWTVILVTFDGKNLFLNGNITSLEQIYDIYVRKLQ